MKKVQKDNYQLEQKGEMVRSKGPNDKKGTSNFSMGEFMRIREWYDFTIAPMFCMAFIYVLPYVIIIIIILVLIVIITVLL